MHTCLYSLTLHFLLTEELRHVIHMGLALQCECIVTATILSTRLVRRTLRTLS